LPREIRYIIFSDEEVERAVADLLTRLDRQFDPRHIRSTAISHASDGALVCVVMLDAAAPYLRLEVSEPDLMSALLLYCRNRNIPLPVKADKHLEITGGGFALVASIRSRSQAPDSARASRP
jgi:hypothetical protein